MTDKQFRFARTSQCYCLGQRENACSKANCTQIITETIATLPGGWDLAHAIRLGIKPFAGDNSVSCSP